MYLYRASLALLALALGGCAAEPTTAADPAESAVQAPATTQRAPQPPAKPADTTTAGQRNALSSAESYLRTMSFSRAGLIKQLEFEKYSAADATWAADHVKVNWNEQAAKAAAQYLRTMPFSHGALVHQLVFDGFTPQQAEYGTTQAGL